MESIEKLLEECNRLHGHLCAGQLLGVRMALLGCGLVGIYDPRGEDRKRLIAWVEIDRCMTDAVSAVCALGQGRLLQRHGEMRLKRRGEPAWLRSATNRRGLRKTGQAIISNAPAASPAPVRASDNARVFWNAWHKKQQASQMRER